MLNEKDNKQISSLGISKGEIEKQLKCFKDGFPYIKLLKPAVENDGIYVLDLKRQEFCIFHHLTTLNPL